MKGAYIGIVKKVTETMVGVDMQIITKFANDESILEGWMRLYPEQQGIIMDNNEILEKFFKDFEDVTHLTYEESLIAEKLYRQLSDE